LWIDRWIDDENLCNKLLKIRNDAQDLTRVSYYIDSSLSKKYDISTAIINGSNMQISMGAAFIL
jgi:hypothetical protein